MNAMKERAETGRLFAHHSHVEMKEFVRNIKKQEGSLKPEQEENELTDAQKVDELIHN